MNALDKHAETVMARVRGVLGAHAPDLLLAFEGLILMDSLAEEKPSEVPAIPLESEPPPVNLTPFEREVEFPRTNGVHEAKPEPRVDVPVVVKPATPAILERPVVPPRAVVEPVPGDEEAAVSVEGKSVEELIEGAPKLSSPHDPEKMVQLVRSMVDDPTGTNSGPFVAKFLCIPVQGTHWVLRWIRYHAEVLPNLKNYQKAEYLQKLLLDRQQVKKAAA